MSESLYPYYERELLFIRQLAQEFGQRYPAAAGRLLLGPTHSGDPHIERMIESFSLLSARVHHKLDDEFPELTDALLGIMYPHYLAPIPSMAIVQLGLDAARGRLPDGFTVPRHSRLKTAPVQGLPCRFRTGYPVELWPVEIAEAALLTPPFPVDFQPPRKAAGALRLVLRCQSQLKFSELSLEKLRLYLFGAGPITSTVYELLLNHVVQAQFRASGPPRKAFTLPPGEVLSPVGFSFDEALLPSSGRGFAGYRLLSEFFALREKFLFVDLGGFRRVREAGFGDQVEVILFLNRAVPHMEEWVDPANFRLGCTPIVNLFEQVAEPIALTQRRYEYRIVPEVAHPRGLEVYSVDQVTHTDPTTNTTKTFHPFYSFHHARLPAESQTFWHATRRESIQPEDNGTDVFLNLVDLDFHPHLPAEATLVVRTTCTNRDLPVQLQQAGDRLYLELEGAAPLTGIRCLRPPTNPLRPPRRRGRYWALISHLSLNFLSLSDSADACDALREMLRLYDFSDPRAGQAQLSEVTRQLIEGVVSVKSRRIVGRTGSSPAAGFARGMEVTIEFDPEKYVGTGMYLFASVLERFLGLYASINSFSRLVAKTTQTEGYFKQWPLRAGEQQLL